MSESEFYRHKQGTTFTEIYSASDDGDERIVHRQFRDQAAYDHWHLALYFKEILSYRRFFDGEPVTLDDIPRKEKNLMLYLVLAAAPRFRSVLEMGSALFEMIDGLKVVGRYLARQEMAVPKVKRNELSYIGVELSELMAEASKVLHPQNQMTVVRSPADAPTTFDVLYDQSVTNYAFDSSTEFAELVNRAEVAFLNTYFSKGQTFRSGRLGKSLTYFSLAEVISKLDKPLFHLFGEQAPGPLVGPPLNKGVPAIEGYFLCAEPEYANVFIDTARASSEIAKYFDHKLVRLSPAEDLLP